MLYLTSMCTHLRKQVSARECVFTRDAEIYDLLLFYIICLLVCLFRLFPPFVLGLIIHSDMAWNLSRNFFIFPSTEHLTTAANAGDSTRTSLASSRESSTSAQGSQIPYRWAFLCCCKYSTWKLSIQSMFHLFTFTYQPLELVFEKLF